MIDEPMPLCVARWILAVTMIATFSTVLLLWGTGCEADHRDKLDEAPELRGEAIDCSRTITDAFGLPANDLRGVTITWGDQTAYFSNGILQIDRALRDDPKARRCHLLDEVMHAVTGLDHNTRTLNGVEIKGVVPSW